MTDLIKTTNESKINHCIVNHDIGLPKVMFSDFQSVLEDRNNLINWTYEESHPCYKGFALRGSTLVKIPSIPVPVLSGVEKELKAYRSKFSSMMQPLKELKQNEDCKKLFEQTILSLINNYPTYCKKDDGFKSDTVVMFLTFLEDYPLIIITKAINQWVKTQKSFPVIADLTAIIEKKLEDANKRLSRLDALISVAS